MVTKDDLFRLGKEIRARQTFMVSALTGQNVKLVNILFNVLWKEHKFVNILFNVLANPSGEISDIQRKLSLEKNHRKCTTSRKVQ
jgi:hypothetical protein